MHEKDLHEKIRDENPLKHICFFFSKTVNDVLFPQESSIIDLAMVLNVAAVAQRCFVNKVVLQISGHSQEKTRHRVS